jgi:hypothetical protein
MAFVKKNLGGLKKVSLAIWEKNADINTLNFFDYDQASQLEINHTFEDGFFYEINLQVISDDPILSDVIAISEDRNGVRRLLGLKNGLIATSTKSSGSGKGDFNGYTVTLQGKELFIPYLGEPLADSFLLQENGDFLLQENGFKIIL